VKKPTKIDYDFANELLKINERHVENFNKINNNRMEIEAVRSKVYLIDSMYKRLEKLIEDSTRIAYCNHLANKEKIDYSFGEITSIPQCDTCNKLKFWIFLCFCLICLQYVVFYLNLHCKVM